MHEMDRRISLTDPRLPEIEQQLGAELLHMVVTEVADGKAELASDRCGRVRLAAARYHFSAHVELHAPHDGFVLAFVHEAGPASWVDGMPLEAGTLLSVPPGEVMQLSLRAASAWTLVWVGHARLRQALVDLTNAPAEMPERLRRFRPSLQRAAGLRAVQVYSALHNALMRRLPLHAELEAGDLGALVLRAHLLAGVSATRHELSLCPPARLERLHRLGRTVAYMREQIRQDIYMRDLCAVANSSERTLRYLYSELLGVSPMRYLSMLRLCEASRQLLAADSRHKSVRSIAIGCGLWDLSRFAKQYQALFGELPHQALQYAESDDAETVT